MVYRDGAIEGVAGVGVTSLCPSDGIGKWDVVECVSWGQEVGVVSVKKKSVGVGLATVAPDHNNMILSGVCVGVVKRKLDFQSCCVCGDQLWVLCKLTTPTCTVLVTPTL